MPDNCLDARIRIIAKEEIALRAQRKTMETVSLHEIGGLELPPCAVADVEHFNLLLFFQNAVDHAIHTGLPPVKQVPQFVQLARQRTSVRLPFQTENGLLSPSYHSRAASEYSALICLYNCARSRSACGVILTTYAMLGFKLGEKLSRWPCPSCFHILQTLTDAFLLIRHGGKVEQALIGFGVLDNSRCLPIHRKHHGALALLELFHEVAGLAAERGQRLDVLGDVKHGPAPIESTLLGAARIYDPGKPGKLVGATPCLLVSSNKCLRTLLNA